MITIDDEKRLLNLHYMAIYLMLTPEEIDQYGSKLQELNNFKSLTRGLFVFYVVKKSDTLYEKFPEGMIRAIRQNNLFIRLANTIHGAYCYGMDSIDLTLEAEALRNNLDSFVDEVCKKNINNLDILEHRITSSSRAEILRYRSMNMVAEVFLRARDRNYFSEEEAIYETIERYISSPSFADSHDIFEAYLANDIYRIDKDINETNKPSTHPSISVTIKYVPADKVRKNGTTKKGLGMEYDINGQIVPVLFGSRDQFFLYAAVLMAQIEGKQLKREHFTSRVTPSTRKWLSEHFKIFSFDENFDAWFEKVNRHGKAARINDAKSKINKILWDVLSKNHKDAYHYCCLITENPHSEKTCYKIDISKAQIHLDEAFQQKLG